MTPSDLDISIRLAVFMGWEDGSVYRDIIGTPAVTLWRVRRAQHPMHMDEVLIYPHTGGMKPWHPLLDPSQAALVMSEAARRGWTVEPRMSRKEVICRVSSFLSARSVRIETDEASLLSSWCRAVCLAVIQAIEKEGTE